MFDSRRATALLGQAADWERHKARCDAARFSALADYAELHTALDPEVTAMPGAARLVRVGGDGTPAVDEFCLCELAASAHLQEDTARRQLAVALDLRYRLPGVQAALAAGRIPGWRAKLVADATRALSLEQVRLAEARLLPILAGLGARRLGEIVTQVVIDTDPDAAERRAEAARERRHVTLDPRHEQEHGLISGAFTADAGDALRFHTALDKVAGWLAYLGDTDPAHVRRAKALGYLANPHQALALMQRATAASDGGSDASRAEHGGTWPEAMLYVHFTRDQWNRDRAGAASLDGVGPITVDQARGLLGNAHVTVKPVIDLDHSDTSDARFARGRLREAVVLKTPHCPFPYCSRPARHNQIDHTTPVPHGRTAIDNLSPPDVKHHRAKTHAGWQLRQPFNGVYVWKSPLGRVYLVDNRGVTHDLGDSVSGRSPDAPSERGECRRPETPAR
jgi:Domain of unknown function (DUF222)